MTIHNDETILITTTTATTIITTTPPTAWRGCVGQQSRPTGVCWAGCAGPGGMGWAGWVLLETHFV